VDEGAKGHAIVPTRGKVGDVDARVVSGPILDVFEKRISFGGAVLFGQSC